MLHSKKLLLPICIVAAIFILQSCNKNSSNSNSNNNNNNNNGTIKEIYVAGYGINNLGKQVALLWKNDTVKYLTNGTRNAVASSVFVDGDNVYVAGYQDASNSNLNVATYWLNGAAVPLGTTGGTFDKANSIYVNNGTVYIAGWQRDNTTGNDVAKYWIGSTVNNLTDGSKEARATGVFAVGNDVYVSGYEVASNGRSIAKYWKNNVAVNLSNGSTDAEGLCIYVDGTDVYVGGSIKNDLFGYQAVYWKNGFIKYYTTASSQAAIHSITVKNNNIYAAGIEVSGLNYGRLWGYGSNPELLPIGQFSITPGGIATSVFVKGDDVFAAGSLNGPSNNAFPIYWKNGVSTSLRSELPNGGPAAAYSVFATYQ